VPEVELILSGEREPGEVLGAAEIADDKLAEHAELLRPEPPGAQPWAEPTQPFARAVFPTTAALLYTETDTRHQIRTLLALSSSGGDGLGHGTSSHGASRPIGKRVIAYTEWGITSFRANAR
jgi:hypothetical protein